MSMGKQLVGTPRYASLATHLGYEQGRRDDVEVIGNTLIFLYKGSLPWEDYFEGENRWEKYANIAKKVKSTSLSELCDGCPIEFFKFMQYCRKLAFDKEPDYEYLVGLLEKCKKAIGFTKKTTKILNIKNTKI